MIFLQNKTSLVENTVNASGRCISIFYQNGNHAKHFLIHKIIIISISFSIAYLFWYYWWGKRIHYSTELIKYFSNESIGKLHQFQRKIYRQTKQWETGRNSINGNIYPFVLILRNSLNVCFPSSSCEWFSNVKWWMAPLVLVFSSFTRSTIAILKKMLRYSFLTICSLCE